MARGAPGVPAGGGGAAAAAGAGGDGFGARPVPRPRRRPPAAAGVQEQGGLLPRARPRRVLQRGVPGRRDVRVLGEAAAAACADAGAPGGGAPLVGRLRRRLHGHGVRAAVGEVRAPQPGAPWLVRQGVRGEELGRRQHRQLPHPELPVVARPPRRVGAHGVARPRPRQLRRALRAGAHRAPAVRGGRPVGARVPARHAAEQVGGQDVHRERLRAQRLLGRDSGQVRGAAAEGATRRGPRRRRRPVAVRHALRRVQAVPAVRGQLPGGPVPAGDGARVQLRRRPDNEAVRVPARVAQHHRGAARRKRDRRPAGRGRRGAGPAIAPHVQGCQARIDVVDSTTFRAGLMVDLIFLYFFFLRALDLLL